MSGWAFCNKNVFVLLTVFLLLAGSGTHAAPVTQGSCRSLLIRLLRSGEKLEMLHVRVNPEAVQQFLPDTLAAHSPDHLQGIQKKARAFMRKPSTARAMYQLVNGETKELGDLSGDDFIRLLEPEIKYNITVTSDEIKLMKIAGDFVGDNFSKHLVISQHSDDIRYAGEIWVDADGHLFLNNNSGTYQPTLAHGEKAVEALRKELNIHGLELDRTNYDYGGMTAAAIQARAQRDSSLARTGQSLYELQLKAIKSAVKNRNGQTRAIPITGKLYDSLELTYGKRLGVGYRGAVYRVEAIDPIPESVIHWNGPVVVKVPNKFALVKNLNRQAQVEAEREILSVEVLQQNRSKIQDHTEYPKAAAWSDNALPVIPILDSMNTKFGTLIFKPEISGKSLKEIQAEDKLLPPEMLQSLEEIYALTRAIAASVPDVKLHAAEKSAHAMFQLDINPNNLVWIDDPVMVAKLGLSRPSFVMYEMTPLRNRTPQYVDLSKDRLMTELGVDRKEVVAFKTPVTFFEKGKSWSNRYKNAYFHKDRIPRYTDPGPNPSATLDPKDIYFMQDACENMSQDGVHTALQNAKEFRSGTLKPDALPPIEVWKDENGRIWSLDHRRLAAIRLAGNIDQIPVKWAPPDLVKHDGFKYSTTTEGRAIYLDLGDDRALIVR